MDEQETYEQYLQRAYPKAKYHASFPPTVAYSPAEEEKLGPQWVDHPDLVGVVADVLPEDAPNLVPDAPLPPPKRRGRPPKEKTE